MLTTATEVKNNFGKYLNAVMNDEDVVITKNGKKVARLTPYVTDVERYFTVRESALDYRYGGKKVSYEEFMIINEKSSTRMEFINGEIYLLDSPNVSHQDILGRLYVIFLERFKGKKCRPFIAPFDVHFRKKDIKDPDVMQPDLLVACDLEGNVNEKDRYIGTPTLVLEILSQSTRSKDMVDKLSTYMTSGVKEYWIVDPKQEKIIVYIFNNFEIENLEIYNKEQIAKSFEFEGLCVNVKEIFSSIF
ncbi:type II toxin-antitoxin system prevent-host-death family antitoxin [Vallitalea okinawensis]|uniref:type II toxin-antitoxin system prevent-host-death family antitoxin n=1 Tax=Vallitalea okinawensis TaxID=2078660 RepID=UPI000CFCE2B2|nr:type II toxin-antitoxin system prevent-host-death family antitoxin [Vallitalea okinawensis]